MLLGPIPPPMMPPPHMPPIHPGQPLWSIYIIIALNIAYIIVGLVACGMMVYDLWLERWIEKFNDWREERRERKQEERDREYRIRRRKP